MAELSMSPPGAARPLLSIAIPTFERVEYLTELLEALLPQVAREPRVELIVSDNASTDATPAMMHAFVARGLPVRYVRNPENIGSDANFMQCLDLARGTYAWVLGDDDLVQPYAIRSLLSLLQQSTPDLVYLSSYGFSGSYQPRLVRDRLGRFAEVVTDGAYFLEKVNSLIGLISVVIINKDRLLDTPHPDIATLNESNLLQLGWIFPLLPRRCNVLYVWERLVAYRTHNSGGWGVCEVFGVRLDTIARRYFAAQPALAHRLMNGVLRYWMPDAIIGIRRGQHARMPGEDVEHHLLPVHRANWRYWVFVHPVAKLPLWAARPLHFGLRLVNEITRAAQGLWRHMFRHGRYLRP